MARESVRSCIEQPPTRAVDRRGLAGLVCGFHAPSIRHQQSIVNELLMASAPAITQSRALASVPSTP